MFASLKNLRARATPKSTPKHSPAATEALAPPPTSGHARNRLLELLQEHHRSAPHEAHSAPCAQTAPAHPAAPLSASPSNAQSADKHAGAGATHLGDLPHAPAAPTQAPAAPALHWGPEVLSHIEWRRFVSVVVGLLHQKGLSTQTATPFGLCGMDVRMQQGRQQLNLRCLGGRDEVTQQDVQNFLRTLRQQRLRAGTLVTRGRFTPAAKELAKLHRIHPLDGQDVLALVARQSSRQQQSLWLAAHTGNHACPSCMHCGSKMHTQTRHVTGTPFWACCNAPECSVQLPASHTNSPSSPAATAAPAASHGRREIHLKITVSGKIRP